MDTHKALSVVALLKCDTYQRPFLKEQLIKGLSLIGFDPSMMKGARVVLKPNLLSAVDHLSGVVTHPEFFRAAVEIVLENGGNPILVESPAVSSLENALTITGYQQVIDELSIDIAQGKSVTTIANEQGRIFKYFEVIPELLEADIILNLPKFKTHELTYITGAVKNLFGFIPGMRKSQMHMRFSDKISFCEFLLDLYGAVTHGLKKNTRVLHLMDAIIGLEGQGPGSSGRPRKIGVVLISEDAVALDYIATKVAGLDVAQHQTVVSGFARGYCPSGPKGIDVKGEQVSEVKISGYLPAGSPRVSRFIYSMASSKTIRDLFIARPVPDSDRCTLCYQCRKICPAGAIEKAQNKDKTPFFDYRKCIRCYCCMEVCPSEAITLRRGTLQWVLRL